MPEISKITLPTGTTYDIKDATAREEIATIVGGNVVRFIGVSTTPITDGGSETPTIAGWSDTVKSGDICFYGSAEFIYGNDSKWHETGDLSSLGALAYKDSATGTITPTGTVTAPTFTGASSTVTITATDSANGNYQPKGTISGGAFTGAATTFSGTFTPSGTISVTTSATSNKTAAVSSTSGTVTYTPAGTVTAPTFTGTAGTYTGDFTPAGSVSVNSAATSIYITAALEPDSGTSGQYQPTGSVTAPTISVSAAGATTSIKNPTKVTVAKTVVAAAPGATAPSNAITYYNVTGETLSLYQLGYTTGDSITTSNVTVKTGDATYTASQPAFSGTTVYMKTSYSKVTGASFAGTQSSVEVSGTPSGTVGAPTFSGTGVRLVTGNIAVPASYSATFTGTAGDVSVSGTPNGSVGAITFAGTTAQLQGTTTASGTVSQPTFTGSPVTITVT